MMHIKATITFNKDTDNEQLEIVKSTILTYNMLASTCGAQQLDSCEVDCGDTIEIRFDTDFDTLRMNDFQKALDEFENTFQFQS